MRVTNNMIMRNSSYNIGGTKTLVDKTNNQMTTQKKINRPSDDPVIAIRSLRLGTSLAKTNQYYEKNIPDAESWLDVTETALTNMKTLMTDVRTQVVNGTTDTLTQDDRNTILTQLQALQSQLYSEGNADYAGRTVFTGYRTDKDLIFTENELETSYTIDQPFEYTDMESFDFYSGEVNVPTTQAEVMGYTPEDEDIAKTSYYRIHTAYRDIDNLSSFSYSYGEGDTAQKVEYNIDVNAGTVEKVTTTGTGDTATSATEAATNVHIYADEAEWEEDMQGKNVNDSDIVIIKSTGNIIFGADTASEIKINRADMATTFDKTGFNKGELKPEYYFNCTDKTNPLNPVTFTKYDENGDMVEYDINYTVASSQQLTVNLEASDAFNSDLQRDIDDMIDVVNRSLKAHTKVDQLKAMKNETQYEDATYQEMLDKWIVAAEKEADMADDHLHNLFSQEIGRVDSYISDINLAITKVGCTVDQLKLTETRMSNQQLTIQELQSENEDLDLSTIILKYTASYNAYQSSLTAAGKLSGMTLLNYI
ncbi:MAG: flagellar hook-associated protein FlgL [Lachnospiraceae bacterium]|nr:flagellar hook-associated protein FlgL [Lachnospiraceae bacterium]